MVLGQLKRDSSFIDFKINNAGSFKIETLYPIAEGKFETSGPKAFKKLTIRKLGSNCLFFINEELKYSYPVEELATIRTGPITYEKSSVWVDFVRIDKIEVK